MKHSSIAYCPPNAVLPVIFVPGIMGSRLKATSGPARREPVWDPPRSGDLPRDATRATDPLIPPEEIRHYDFGTTIYDQNPRYSDESYTRTIFHRQAQEEVQGPTAGGWEWGQLNAGERRQRLINPEGGPFNENYLEVDYGNKEDFANRLGPDIVDMALQRGWGGCVWEFYGGFLRWLHYNGGAALWPGGDIRLEVWAHPYNWTDDNKNSARDLAKTVERAHAEAKAKYADRSDYPVLKPVVITHSMGGLVARAYAKHFGGDSACFAMIHGAMPTHGSPAAYKRMRKGFEGAASVVLGFNGAEVTAVLANAPGGLQLLPNQFHRTADGSRQWLFADGEPPLPATDPYGEIYRNREKWWRLVNADWVNPGTVEGYELFRRELRKAQKFHTDLGEYFHPYTTMFWSGEHLCWDRVEITAINTNSGPGPIIYRYEYTEVAPQSAEGDGTVHAGSGSYVPVVVESVSEHIEDGDELDFTHEGAFAENAARSQVAFWLKEFVRAQLKNR